MASSKGSRRAESRQATQRGRHEEAASNAVHDKYTPEVIERTHLDAQEAERRIESNPEAWETVVEEFCTAAAEGRRINADEIARTMRRRSFVSHDRADKGRTVKYNHNFIPYLVRRICRDHPEVKPFVELRGSRFDVLFENTGVI